MKNDATARLLRRVHDRLYAEYGDCGCPLRHATPFQLLVAVILSAQCRDDRVNVVTEDLFAQWPDAETMSRADAASIGTVIRSLGLWRNKAENLAKLARQLTANHAGQVPSTMTELIQLPGVGRKSANVLLGNAFGIPGFPVDTHVQRLLKHFRVAGAADTPEKMEQTVCARMPAELWTNFSHLLITHGRQVCNARTPQCQKCVLRDCCADAKV